MVPMYPRRKRPAAAKAQLRHSHRTAAALEDALAVAYDIILDQQRALTYAASRAEKLVDILQTARKGPHAYDPDRPAGLRVTLKRR